MEYRNKIIADRPARAEGKRRTTQTIRIFTDTVGPKQKNDSSSDIEKHLEHANDKNPKIARLNGRVHRLVRFKGFGLNFFQDVPFDRADHCPGRIDQDHANKENKQ